ncbi:efflux transporter outer membrane subunit [Lutimonas saemankumensis]|uniref:efflux transporter outer membrane subunit n=1 Tax=Lutimonas saemankumensis TaxID=483016 RepID=UPI001CD2B7B1|nr:efflux transporter outer membrane subunit [Lutimonas saemankumensis]MCA0932313.1 efflux transporter outer membrane subunit [Lutimonas saemankumensis]
MTKKLITYGTLGLMTMLFVVSCKVGPNYVEPEDTTPADFRFATKKTDSIINFKWWEIFNDPTLDTLIHVALRENKNLLIAASRIEQARANYKFNKADMGPKFGVQADASVQNQLFGQPLDQNLETYGVNGTVNWELDFWGKFRRGNEAAQAELMASFYGKRAIEVALISEVAINYFQLLDFKTRLDISEKTLASRDTSLQIIQARFDEGYTHIIDVNQAEIQKAIAEVSVPTFRREIGFAENNLSILLGKNPGGILTPKTLIEYSVPDSVPHGIPSELLARRPDVMEAAQLYRAQNARIGVAQAMRFPAISLTGALGVGSNDLSNLLDNGLGWSAGASLLGPLFEWGKNVRRVDIERELARQSLFSYENTVLTALLEVDNSLISLQTLRDELAANEYKLAAAENASYLSRQRYFQGVTSYLEVIENQRQEFEARLSYSENYQRLLSAYIGLYKSLGGGWVTEAELEKYALQLADELNVDESEIDRDSLYYAGQLVDYYLTPEQEQQRKEQRKELNRKEREMRKAARQSAN